VDLDYRYLGQIIEAAVRRGVRLALEEERNRVEEEKRKAIRRNVEKLELSNGNN